MAENSQTLVELNVGGKQFTTLVSTLTKCESNLSKLLSSANHAAVKDAQGKLFLDRDGDAFKL